MPHRIAAGLLVLDSEDRVALVRHVKPGVYDFWVAPGGGVSDGEDLLTAARREAFEEAGIAVGEARLVAIEQLYGPRGKTHQVKHWFFARVGAQTLATDAASRSLELIVEARWLAREELAEKIVFPPFLLTDFWAALDAGFPGIIVMPMREMTFE
jgi:8-oxo-dGTP diphosphatase